MRLVPNNTASTVEHQHRIGPKVEAPVGRLGKTRKFIQGIVRGYAKVKKWVRRGVNFAQQNPEFINDIGGKHAPIINHVVNMADKATRVIEGVTGH
jgi:hypothetical protein